MKKICIMCGNIKEPRTITKGNILTEIILWLFFLLPGIIYSAWRHLSRYEGCPVCKSENMIPLTSPVARKFISDYGLIERYPHSEKIISN